MIAASDQLKGATSLLGGAFLIGTFGLWVRVISPMFGNAAQTAGRFGLAALFMGVFFLIRHRAVRLTKSQLKMAAAIGLASFGLGVLFTIAANQTKITNALALMYAGGIISALVIGTVFLQERLNRRKLLAAGVALAGLAMYGNDFASLNLAVFAAIGAGICDSIAHGFRKKVRGADRNAVVFYHYAVGGLAAGLFMVLSGEQAIKDVSLGAIIGLLVYAIATLVLGSLLLYGFSRFDVNVGAIILATQLLFAAVLGVIFLREIPTLRESAGITLIFLASVCTVVDARAVLRLRRA